MDTIQHKPIELLKTRIYTAYQFFCEASMKDGDAEKTFGYIALTVEQWLATRRNLDTKIEIERYLSDYSTLLNSYEISTESFYLNVAYNPVEKEWAMLLREPDNDRNESKKVWGRFFKTEVAIKIIDEKNVEVGCKVDVIEPEEAEEIDYAYRPLFIRWLLENGSQIGLRLESESERILQCPHYINDNNDYKKFFRLITSKTNPIPIVVFSLCEHTTNYANNNRIQRSGMQLHFDTVNKLLNDVFNTGDTKIKEFANNLSQHQFTYCFTFVLSPSFSYQFIKDMGISCYWIREFFMISPTKYGRKIKRYDFSDIDKEDFNKSFSLTIRSFFKHKPFEYGALSFINEIKLHVEKNDLEKGKEEVLKTTEELQKRIDTLTKQNQDLLKEKERFLQEKKELENLKNQEYNRAYQKFSDRIQNQQEELSKQGKILFEQNKKIEELKEKLNQKKDDSNTVQLILPDMEPLFEGEPYDLLICVLHLALNSYDEDSRATKMIQEFLDKNELIGKGQQWFDDIERIFKRSANFKQSDFSELRQLGFDIPFEKSGTGHQPIRIAGYEFTIASTPSDYKNQKNNYRDIKTKISIYK